MLHNKFRTLFPAAILAAVVVISGCYVDSHSMRSQTADRLAGPTQMLKREINTGSFTLTAFERVRREGGTARIYIAGDGPDSTLQPDKPALNPTPINPVALHLATRDRGPNVIYLARPCQYTQINAERPCPQEYWTDKRFAPEVVDSLSAALDNIKRRYGIRNFELIGFSGGGALAALLTAQRDDVITLRTVSGNLNHELRSRKMEDAPLTGSPNPVDIAAQIAHIPQHHFIAEWDEKLDTDIYDSFRQAAGPNRCMRSSLVKLADHKTGWVSVWPVALARPVDCERETMLCYETPSQCMITDDDGI